MCVCSIFGPFSSMNAHTFSLLNIEMQRYWYSVSSKCVCVCFMHCGGLQAYCLQHVLIRLHYCFTFRTERRIWMLALSLSLSLPSSQRELGELGHSCEYTIRIEIHVAAHIAEYTHGRRWKKNAFGKFKIKSRSLSTFHTWKVKYLFFLLLFFFKRNEF